MGKAAKRARPADEFDAGERWETGRGDGEGLYIAGDPKHRVKIADFGAAGRIPSSVGHQRALVAAQAPRMYEAVLDFVSGARDAGSIVDGKGQPFKGHGPGCGCGICDGLVALAFAEGGGRCIVCGCSEYDACAGDNGEGCAWVDSEQLICTAHPDDVIARAKRFLAAPNRREDRT